MNLFKAHIQKDTDPRKLSEYALLERSTLPEHGQARSLLEQWFHDYPSDAEKQSGRTDHQKSFCAAFQAQLDRQHQAAFFELYCYTLLRRHHFDIEIEPPVETSSHHPDYLVQSAGISICFFLGPHFSLGWLLVVIPQKIRRGLNRLSF